MRQRFTTAGFSLIEVNLALFVVALGMLTMFTLFPAGLKQVEAAQSSTQEAMFAEHVFSTLRAKAMADWNSLVTVQVSDLIGSAEPGSGIIKVEFPTGSSPKSYIRAKLEVASIVGGVRSASLWCRSGEYGASEFSSFQTNSAKFYTEFFYSGMP